jgi:hypothetical protein
MRFDALQEAAVGNCLVRIRSSRVDLPGAVGWIGSWEIHLLPWHPQKTADVHRGNRHSDERESGGGNGEDYCYSLRSRVLMTGQKTQECPPSEASFSMTDGSPPR